MSVQAHILMNLAAGATNDVVRKLKGMDEVLEVSLVYGSYDALAKITVEELDHLGPLVLRIRDEIPHIKDTTTLIQAQA